MNLINKTITLLTITFLHFTTVVELNSQEKVVELDSQENTPDTYNQKGIEF